MTGCECRPFTDCQYHSWWKAVGALVQLCAWQRTKAVLWSASRLGQTLRHLSILPPVPRTLSGLPWGGAGGGGAPRIPQSVPPIQVLGPPGDSPSSGLVCPLLELQPKKWERQVLIPSHSIDKDRITVINTLIRKKNRDFLATDSQGHLDLQGSNLSLNLGEPWSDSRAPLQEGLQGLNFSDSSPSSLFGVLSFPK